MSRVTFLKTNTLQLNCGLFDGADVCPRNSACSYPFIRPSLLPSVCMCVRVLLLLTTLMKRRQSLTQQHRNEWDTQTCMRTDGDADRRAEMDAQKSMTDEQCWPTRLES